MSRTAYADPSILSTLADHTILSRDCAALRMLRLMQSWASEHIVESGRGAVWVARNWIQSRLGIGRSQYYRALGRLRNGGWISAQFVEDEHGRERPGYVVALGAKSGFATQVRPTCDTHATHLRHTCDFPTLKLKEENRIQDKSGAAQMSRKPRQSSLPGVKVELDVTHQVTPTGKPKRDPQLRPIAVRIDEYERERYVAHPRATRPKRSTPEAIDIAVEAIVRALERVVESRAYPDLEAIEARFRAVVELNWESAERRLETWAWWTGSAMWTPSSLERVLGWLEEPRNVVYLHRASGEWALPVRAEESAEPVRELSPREQQAEYDLRHGIPSVNPGLRLREDEVMVIDEVVDARVRIHEPTIKELVGPGLKPPPEGMSIASTGPVEVEYRDGVTEQDVRELTAKCCEPEKVSLTFGGVELIPYRGGPVSLKLSLPMTEDEADAIEQLDDCIDRGDAPGLAELATGMERYVPVKAQSDEELRKEQKRKMEYFKSTTPEQRDADAKAGRKPWEVG